MWNEHFSQLLNSGNMNNNNFYQDKVTTQLYDTTYSQNFNFTVTEITKSIESLKTGKANGPDGLSAEHFKLCGNRLAVLLSLVFTSMSSHCFIPENFMKSVIIPLVKDKTGDITDKNNYRPIALSTMMSKIIEKIFMDRYESLFSTTDNQFLSRKTTPLICVYKILYCMAKSYSIYSQPSSKNSL